MIKSVIYALLAVAFVFVVIKIALAFAKIIIGAILVALFVIIFEAIRRIRKHMNKHN